MSVTPVTEQTLTGYTARLARLTANTPRQWGTMDSAQMLNHLRCLFLVSLGQLDLPDVSNFVTRTALVRAVILAIPWPGGKVKAPIDLKVGDAPASFEEEFRLLNESLNEFVHATTADPKRIGRSPLIGPVPLSYWAKLHGKHLDHHLRQFGV